MKKTVIYWNTPDRCSPDRCAPDTQNRIINALQEDKVLITTTDTIPGFLANITAQSFEALNKIKGGRQNKPYIILISDISKLDYFVQPEQITPQIKNLITKCWPGPLTVIFKAKKELPDFLKSEQGTVAIRCPKHTPLLEVLKHFNGLYSTSANQSSAPAPLTINNVDPQVAAQVEYLVNTSVVDTCVSDTGAAGTEMGKPSTIIDVSNTSVNNRSVNNSRVTVVREGAYSVQDLEEILGEN